MCPSIRIPATIAAVVDRGRALDVVVERADPIAVAVEQAGGVALGEVLPLHEHAGEAVVAATSTKLVDQLVVLARRGARRWRQPR